jgi:hypothetical protein
VLREEGFGWACFSVCWFDREDFWNFFSGEIFPEIILKFFSGIFLWPKKFFKKKIENWTGELCEGTLGFF